MRSSFLWPHPIAICLVLVFVGIVSKRIEASSDLAAKGKATSANLLDLSYLHRTESSLLKQAIRQKLNSPDKNGNIRSAGAHDQESLGSDGALVIDVTASLMDMDDLIASLEATAIPDKETTTDSLHLVAQRNQWSLVDVSKLLSGLLEKPKQLIALSTASSNDTVSENNQTRTDESETQRSPMTRNIKHLDLSWNDLHSGSTKLMLSKRQQKRQAKAFSKALQELIQDKQTCPESLKLQVCSLEPSACRAIGKGLIQRFTAPVSPSATKEIDAEATLGSATRMDDSNTTAAISSTESNSIPADAFPPPSISLYLTRNGEIGDAGVAALSAAIRTASTSTSTEDNNRDVEGGSGSTSDFTVLEVLDLSGCGVTDIGAEALAIALKDHPMCVKRLDLSNNQITSLGAAALGRALASSESKIEYLDLSNNPKIDDSGAKELAAVLEAGNIQALVLRSCQIHADGAAALANGLKAMITASTNHPTELRLDLSGNPLGILRKKTKVGKSKYSASALKEKATAKTTAYMNLIGKTVQKGLKELGIAESLTPDTLESDDEEEEGMQSSEPDDDPSKIKCGALAIADAFLEDEDEEDYEQKDKEKAGEIKCRVDFGLRHCAFDTRASEALAAVRQESMASLGLELFLDVRMNHVLEEHTIEALRGSDCSSEDEQNKQVTLLQDMAERYLEVREEMRVARERSIAAARAAGDRFRAEQEWEDSWGEPVDTLGSDEDLPYYDEPYDEYADRGGNEYYDEGAWDSDADYDIDDDEDNY